MTMTQRKLIVFALMAAALMVVGFAQSWSLSLAILNMCMISAIMAMGINIQWGYAGLFNAGVMGFAALGGLMVVLVSAEPVQETWEAGGGNLMISFAVVVATIVAAILVRRHLRGRGPIAGIAITAILVIGLFAARAFYLPATEAIEAVNPASSGYLGGAGLPVLIAWPLGGLAAAGAAWIIARIALGLRADYLAIATLGISEIVIYILKNEDWLDRGVKNVIGLPRPTPYEVDLQKAQWFLDLANTFGADPVSFSSIWVKLCYAGLFGVVLIAVLVLSELALRSPWGRMMRAIRDNEVSANAMGKDVTGRYREIFILGSAVIGIAGAMLVTLDGQFTPTTYVPMRYTFLIWVMVIVGGSGNNFGALVGGFIVWFAWVEAEPVGTWLLSVLTQWMADDSPIKVQLIKNAAQMRPITMGLVLLLVMRFSPKGVLPEEPGRSVKL